MVPDTDSRTIKGNMNDCTYLYLKTRRPDTDMDSEASQVLTGQHNNKNHQLRQALVNLCLISHY